MNRNRQARIELENSLRDMGKLAVAVSGGVDSLTLSFIAHRLSNVSVEMFHAVSPAVPVEATNRVQSLASVEGWNLAILNAGEFEMEAYTSNPDNRCFYCKTSLYSSIKRRTKAQLVSGTNLDDLDEYRPGLRAAEEYAVRHPFVETKIDKATIRTIAREVGLGEIAELPAGPCLSSRIETGIHITPAILKQVHAIEILIYNEIKPKIVRCRIRNSGLFIELDESTLLELTREKKQNLSRFIHNMLIRENLSLPVNFTQYHKGSAFIVSGL